MNLSKVHRLLKMAPNLQSAQEAIVSHTLMHRVTSGATQGVILGDGTQGRHKTRERHKTRGRHKTHGRHKTPGGKTKLGKLRNLECLLPTGRNRNLNRPQGKIDHRVRQRAGGVKDVGKIDHH